MKRILLIFTVVMFGITSLMAQQQTDKETAKEKAKAEKQNDKNAKKAAREAEQEAAFLLAVKALNDKSFVLEADRVEFKRGTFINVSSTTNFVSLNDGRATVQLSFPGAAIGPNGVGGITVDGTISGAKLEKDKKGNITYSFMIQGVAISANISFRMPNGTNYCTATVTPNFSGNRISFTGYLYPTEQSTVYQGRTI